MENTQSKVERPRVTILRGVSGSGKTTTAEQMATMYGSKIISRDAIRLEWLGENGLEKYFEHGMDKCLEDQITTEEHKRLVTALKAGLDVIIDNTNLRRAYIQEYIDILDSCGITPDMTESITLTVTEEEAKKRIGQRDKKPISEDVLRRQFNYLQTPWTLSSFVDDDGNWMTSPKRREYIAPPFPVTPYEKPLPATLPRAVICDLDGTLAHRRIIMYPYPHLRSFYGYSECDTDVADGFVQLLINSLPQDITILFVSGRKNDCRQESLDFIKKNIYTKRDYRLLMRDPEIDQHDGKDDPDDKVKYRIFNESIRGKFDVLGVFDDRKRVVALWETLGLPVANMGKLNELF